jgi:mono/diheme cytochrome c family protein
MLCSRWLCLILSGAFAATLIAQQPRYLPAKSTPAVVYTSTCTGCHGPDGDGVGRHQLQPGQIPPRGVGRMTSFASSCAAFLNADAAHWNV